MKIIFIMIQRDRVHHYTKVPRSQGVVPSDRRPRTFGTYRELRIRETLTRLGEEAQETFRLMLGRKRQNLSVRPTMAEVQASNAIES